MARNHPATWRLSMTRQSCWPPHRLRHRGSARRAAQRACRARTCRPCALQEPELMMPALAFAPPPGGAADRGAARKEFVEKSFFEYHLYTLSAPSTVRDKQVKQLSLLQRKGVKAQRRYIYDPQLDNQ